MDDYHLFFERFYESSEKHLFDGVKKKYFVFCEEWRNQFDKEGVTYVKADKPFIQSGKALKVDKRKIKLNKFKYISQALNQIVESDFVLYFDADSVIKKDIKTEDLVLPNKSLIGALHGFPSVRHGRGSKGIRFEDDPKSSAYVDPEKYDVSQYFQSCIWGGTPNQISDMVKTIARWINSDEKMGHKNKYNICDEIYVNKYFLQRKECMHILGPEYANPGEGYAKRRRQESVSGKWGDCIISHECCAQNNTIRFLDANLTPERPKGRPNSPTEGTDYELELSTIKFLKSDEKKSLLIGPWFGEFGWELFGYIPKVRGFVEDNNFEKVIVMCRSGRADLYRDFANEVIEFDVDGEDSVRDTCRSIDDEVKTKVHEKFYEISPDFHICGGAGIWWDFDFAGAIHMNRDVQSLFIKNFWYSGAIETAHPFPHKHFRYGESSKQFEYDFVVHARNSIKTLRKKGYIIDNLRNWEKEKWQELINKFNGYKVACIGSKTHAHCLDGCEDLRDLGLSEIANVLRSSKLIVGPSSGPMHFASLCECPQVIWDNVNSRSRYERHWNPFKTKVYYYDNEELENDPHWHPGIPFGGKTYTHSPPVENIYDLLNRALKEK